MVTCWCMLDHVKFVRKIHVLESLVSIGVIIFITLKWCKTSKWWKFYSKHAFDWSHAKTNFGIGAGTSHKNSEKHGVLRFPLKKIFYNPPPPFSMSILWVANLLAAQFYDNPQTNQHWFWQGEAENFCKKWLSQYVLSLVVGEMDKSLSFNKDYEKKGRKWKP